MTNAPQILFISGSIGLGHVTRDLAIAAELRRLCPGLRLVWLAADAARQVLVEVGEELAAGADSFSGETNFAEQLAGRFRLCFTNPAIMLKSPRVFQGLVRLVRDQRRNVACFQKLTQGRRFDLMIADEAYDIILAIVRQPSLKPAPMAMIFDFVGLDAVTRNPLERLWVHLLNWGGTGLVKRFPRVFDLTLLVCEEADVADKPLGLFLPNRRELAKSFAKFVGYVCPFDPAEYWNRTQLRERLGYGPDPLVICAIGGTAIGAPLLELCGRAFPILKRRFPKLRMVVVCGPRLSPEKLQLPIEVARRGYVPRLYEHLAACDLAIVQGGGTTTLELTALQRPFLYFPLEHHFEQRCHVAKRLERQGAGVRLEYRDTTPESLAAAVSANIGAEARYPLIATDGARKAAERLCALIKRAQGTQDETHHGRGVGGG